MPNEISFVLGPPLATPGALAALARNQCNGMDYVRRHARGDWGDICDEDKRANHAALQTGARLMSVYRLPDGTVLWVITDAVIDAETGERQATTLLLPEEY